MYTVPDVEGIAINFRAEYRDMMHKVDGKVIPGLYKKGKEKQYNKFLALATAMTEYLEAAVFGFSAEDFEASIFF